MSATEESQDRRAQDARAAEGVRQRERARRKMLLAGEFYARLAEAAAAGFRAFRDEVETDKVEARGLAHSFVLGLTQGHTRFVDHAAEATRELLDPPEEG